MNVNDAVFYFHVQIDAKGAREALFLLNRALNTLEPRDWPEWAQPLINRLERIVDEQA